MPGWRGRPCLGAPRFRLKRSDHRKAGSSGPGQQQREANPLQRKSPFPSGEVPHCGAFVHPEMPFSAGVKGTPLSGAPRFRLKRSDHRKAGSSGPGQQQRETNPLQRKSPFPSREVPHCGAFVHPEIPFPAGMGGDASVWSAPFPAQALRSSEGWIFRPRSAAARNKSSPVEIPFSGGGMVPHCGVFVHPETPFPTGVKGTPLSGAPRFRLRRSDHRKAGSSGPRSAAARSKSSPVEIPFPIGGWFRIAEHSSTRKSPFMPRWRGCPCLGAPRFRLKRSDHRKAGSSGPRSAAARSKPTQWRSPRCWTSRRTCRSPCSSQSKYIRHLQPS